MNNANTSSVLGSETSVKTQSTQWSLIRQVFATLLARLRFVAILTLLGLAIVQWEVLTGYYEKWTYSKSEAISADADVEFYCPMHPTIVRDNNEEPCPICFMPLAKRKKGGAGSAPLPAGVVSRVQLSPYRVVLAGVRTIPVSYVPLTKQITTVGTVEFDERKLKHVAARVKGRIDHLTVNQTGQRVRKGDELARLYSPDLVVTAQNFIDARRSGNAELEHIARERLLLWGLEADQIDQIAASGRSPHQIVIRSPTDGYIIKKYQIEGRYVDEGSPLYDVVDLSTIWIQAQIYEDDLAFLPKGYADQLAAKRWPVVVTVSAYPGQEFAGVLSFVYPHLDQISRTLTVRAELNNISEHLKPGMTATVKLLLPASQLKSQQDLVARWQYDGDRVLAVPEECVIDTGSAQLVYREESPGVYDAVRVELGPRLNGPEGLVYFPVLAGLQAGETIVAAGAFLIDAETRLNPAAASIYIGGTGSGKAASTVRPSALADPAENISAMFAKLPPADRALAQAQTYCAVRQTNQLGSMGVPVKIVLHGQAVFLCCSGCIEQAKANPENTLQQAEQLRRKSAPAPSAHPEEDEIQKALAKMSPNERRLAERQRYCPISHERLGSMGVPVLLHLQGKTVFVCCNSCVSRAQATATEVLRIVEMFLQGQQPKR
jgi:RND family efflux transporter MFP subunit